MAKGEKVQNRGVDKPTNVFCKHRSISRRCDFESSLYALLAQLVEQSAVNRFVLGSSPR